MTLLSSLTQLKLPFVCGAMLLLFGTHYLVVLSDSMSQLLVLILLIALHIKVSLLTVLPLKLMVLFEVTQQQKPVVRGRLMVLLSFLLRKLIQILLRLVSCH